MLQYNPKLKSWLANKPNKEAGINNIQKAIEPEFIVWHIRAHVPSSYEESLVQHLIQAFENGVTEIDELVNVLNEKGLRHEGGELFSVESFQAQMARLGY